MNWNDTSWVAPVLIALINMIGSVLLQWIRGKYQITEQHNGHGKPIIVTPPTPPPGHPQ